MWSYDVEATANPIRKTFKHTKKDPIPMKVSVYEGVITLEFGRFLVDGEYVKGITSNDCGAVTAYLNSKSFDTYDYCYFIVTIDLRDIESSHVTHYRAYYDTDCAQYYMYRVESNLVYYGKNLLVIKATGNGALTIDNDALDSLCDAEACAVASPLLDYLYKQSGGASEEGYQAGYDAGHTDGYNEGYADGYDNGWEGYQSSEEYADIIEGAYNQGFAEGSANNSCNVDHEAMADENYNNGYRDGWNAYKGSDEYSAALDDSYADGYNDGYTEGKEDGACNVDHAALKQEGYNEGLIDGKAQGACNVDHEALRQEGYNDGYADGWTEGEASVNKEALKQQGYTDGYAQGLKDGNTDGSYQEGYGKGLDDGYQNGWNAYKGSDEYSAALDDAYADGWTDGEASVNKEALKQQGYTDGYDDGVASVDVEKIKKEAEEIGFGFGWVEGYDDSKWDAYLAHAALSDYVHLDPADDVKECEWSVLVKVFHMDSYNYGYSDGYLEGYSIAELEGGTYNNSMKSMIFSLFEAPAVLMEGMLDFDLFGVNLFALVKTLLTLAVVAAVVIVLIKFAL